MHKYSYHFCLTPLYTQQVAQQYCGNSLIADVQRFQANLKTLLRARWHTSSLITSWDVTAPKTAEAASVVVVVLKGRAAIVAYWRSDRSRAVVDPSLLVDDLEVSHNETPSTDHIIESIALGPQLAVSLLLEVRVVAANVDESQRINLGAMGVEDAQELVSSVDVVEMHFDDPRTIFSLLAVSVNVLDGIDEALLARNVFDELQIGSIGLLLVVGV